MLFNQIIWAGFVDIKSLIVDAITFIFSIVWYIEPSVLTLFSLLGVILCAVDFAVPTISSYLFSGAEWTVVQERSFENICSRLLNARTHINNVRIALINLKNENPKAYLLVMMGAFGCDFQELFFLADVE